MAEKTFGGPLPKHRPVAIGIDQSLTGFAVTAICIDAPNEYITWVFKSGRRGVSRLADIQWWLESKFDLLDTQGNRIMEIAMEGTVVASQAASVLGELAGVVKLVCWHYFDGTANSTIPFPTHLRVPLQIPPMTVKKYAAGKGNAKKQEMLMQIYKRYGVEFNDDNAADSYAIARMAAGLQTNAVETQIIEQIKDPKFRDSTPE